MADEKQVPADEPTATDAERAEAPAKPSEELTEEQLDSVSGGRMIFKI